MPGGSAATAPPLGWGRPLLPGVPPLAPGVFRSLCSKSEDAMKLSLWKPLGFALSVLVAMTLLAAFYANAAPAPGRPPAAAAFGGR